MTIHIATVFDKNYLIRALALYHSVRTYVPTATLWMLCLDEESVEVLQALNLESAVICSLADINDKELEAVRTSRSSAEFAMTSKASFLSYIFKTGALADTDVLLFIDADICFFSPAETIIQEAAHRGTIILTSHQFSKKKEHVAALYGIYNSGFIMFTNTPEARRAVSDWRVQCIDWCYLSFDHDRHGDQRYLNVWPQKYQDVYILSHKGVNLGTWNIGNYHLQNTLEGVTVDGEPLVCFHFHGLKIYVRRDGTIGFYPISVFHLGIYTAYRQQLFRALKEVLPLKKEWAYGFVAPIGFFRNIKQSLQRLFR